MRTGARITTLLAALVVTVGMTGCTEEAQPVVDDVPTTLPAPLGALAVEYSDTDLDAGEVSSTASHIIFSDGLARFEGTGADVKGSVVTVRSAGTHVVSGSSDDGQLIVELEGDDVVRLIFNGLDIACTTSAPVLVENADKVVITLAKGSDNRVACSAPAAPDGTDSSEPDAAVFSKSDLTINGNGSLEVSADHRHGIVSRDDLKIVSGVIAVEAAKDGLKGRDCIGIKDGSLTVVAGGDGLQSNNDKDDTRGYVAIAGGRLDVTAGLDGVQAANTLLVLGGEISLATGGGSAVGVPSDDASTKGLKSAVGIHLVGGVIDIDSSDDAVNSSGSVQIDGGAITASTGDDGVRADDYIEVNGGTLAILTSYEGLESPMITVNDGVVQVVASDDAINAVTIRVEVLLADKPGQKHSHVPDGSEVHINGGYVTLDGSGDGFDSNDSIYMKGGTVIVNGPAPGWNTAIDWNGEFVATGGYLVAAGASRLVSAPSTSSPQHAILVKFSSPQDAGTLVHIVSEDGVELLTFKPVRQYESVVFSSPEIEDGVTYDVYLGGESTGTVKDGVFSGGTYSGGTRYTSLTISGSD